jgi:hypothetical protein
MKKTVLILMCFLCTGIVSDAQVDSSVPVRIISIDALPGTNYNKLVWKTACFLEYANFEIQRSYDGSNYVSINSFTADRLRCLQPFDYSDYSANQMAGRIFYRLKVGDKDGKIYNSKIVSVITHGQGIEINSFVPTIVNSSADLSISSSANDNAIITIINAQGVIVRTQKIKLNKGVNTIQMSTAELQTGKYWLSLRNSKNDLRTIPFLKQ